MLVAIISTTTFIEVSYPPITITDLFVTAYARTGQPKYRTNEYAQNGTVGEILREIELRELV
ncbi:hypothetical protein BADSM9389_23680 [Buttiauxella agrestis]|nr:hypothetical protein BADSM9389_23680 [Buttiauxella agrestis]